MGSTANSDASVAGQAGWTRHLARDLFPGPTTPFARTFLAAPAQRAVQNTYNELGGQAPDTSFWQFDGAYAYLNGAAIAEADHSLCGAGWLGNQQPEAPGGLRAKLQAGGVIRRCQARQAAAVGEATGLQTRLSRWWAWVQGLKWTQADLLQVMEELEPHALSALQTYFLVRTALNAAATGLDSRLREWLPGLSPETRTGLALGIANLPSASTVEAVLHAARLSPSDSDRLTTLGRVSHRGPGEIRPDATRWADEPQLLSYLAEQGQPRWTPAVAAAERQRSLATVERSLNGGQFRQMTGPLEALHGAMRATDIAWNSLTLVMAAAQRWVAAVGRETMAAGLITRHVDVLYLELEELKQVATGEWHAGDREDVLAAVERRTREVPRALVVGASGPALMVSPGACQGPSYCDSPVVTLPPAGAAWSSETADPGCAPFWSFASCVQPTGGDPWSPGMVAARTLGVPAKVGV